MFDPTTLPVLGVDDHLPPVPSQRLSAMALRQRFLRPPSWQPEPRDVPPPAGHPLRAAAVLVPLVLRERPMLWLTERATDLPTHAGQIAFPGGKVDPQDASPVAAALREADEEMGLSADMVEVLGHMPSYITGTAFEITPVVALVSERFVPRPQVGEVAEAFEVPLEHLMDPRHHRHHAYVGQDREVHRWYSMPYHDGVRERFIWGATAGMLRNLYRFLMA